MERVIGSWRVSVERIPFTEDELAGIYDASAPHWHASLARLGYRTAYTGLFDRLWNKGLLDHLQDGDEVLDCGVGTAAFGLALAGNRGRMATGPTGRPIPRLRVHGADISPGMIQEARRALDAEGVEHCLVRADVRVLPFEEETFDLVMGAHVLEHLSDPLEGLREMVRVLEPGAPLILMVTRPGSLGRLLHLKWRNSCVGPTDLLVLMKHVGLRDASVHELPAGPPWCRWTSVACIGVKA